MIREFFATVPGQRLVWLSRQLLQLLDERINDCLRVLIGYLCQHRVMRMTLDGVTLYVETMGSKDRRRICL